MDNPLDYASTTQVINGIDSYVRSERTFSPSSVSFISCPLTLVAPAFILIFIFLLFVGDMAILPAILALQQ